MDVGSTLKRNGSSVQKNIVLFVPTKRSTVTQPFWGTVIPSEHLAYRTTPCRISGKRYAAYDTQLPAHVRCGVHLLSVPGRGVVHRVLPPNTTTPRYRRRWPRPCQLRDRSPQQEGPRCTCWWRLAVELRDSMFGRIQWVATAQSRIGFCNTVFRAGPRHCCVSPSVHVATQPLNGFSRNLVLENFTKISRTLSVFINAWQRWLVFYLTPTCIRVSF